MGDYNNPLDDNNSQQPNPDMNMDPNSNVNPKPNSYSNMNPNPNINPNANSNLNANMNPNQSQYQQANQQSNYKPPQYQQPQYSGQSQYQQQNQQNSQYQNYNQYNQPASNRINPLAIIALVCGGLSLFCCCLGPFATIIGIGGIVCAILSFRKNTDEIENKNNRIFAIIGIVLSSLGALTGIVITFIYIFAANTPNYYF